MSGERTKFRQLETGTITWDVELDPSGYFYAKAPKTDLPEVAGETFEKLEASCKRHASKYKVKVQVPYVRFVRRSNDGFAAVHGVAVGIHAGNGKILVREGQLMSDGNTVLTKAEPITPYAHDVYSPLEEGDEKRVVEINNQLLALQRERNALLSNYGWKRGFGGTVQDAIDATVKAAQPGE
jgi:hypothetical protein